MSLNPTKIEWVKNPDGTQGYTWNPIVGCSRAVKAARTGRPAAGCATSDKCWARGQAKRQRQNCQRCYDFVPHLHPERLADLSRKKPAGIFVCSMGELFDPHLSDSEIMAVRDAMADAYWHRFYILTKQPLRAGEFLKRSAGTYTPNWWIGTSASTQAEADERIPQLLKLRDYGPWPVLFVSIEPLLEPLDVCDGLGRIALSRKGIETDGLDWVIVGGQTGPGAVKPHPTWVRSLRRQCLDAGVPVFEKDNLRLPAPVQQMPDGTSRE